MRKLRDDEKKLLLLIILIALVVFTIVFIDLAQTLKGLFQQTDEPILSPIEQAVKEINLSPKNEDSAFLRESVSLIFELINEKNYEELYKLLSPDFQEEIFDSSSEKFAEYMQQYAPSQYTPKYTEYQKYDNFYVLGISFLQYSEDITKSTGNVLKFDNYCIRKIDGNNFTFSFNGFIGKKQTNIVRGNKLLKMTLTESMLTYSSSSFMIEFENLTDTDIVIPGKQIYTVTGVKPKYYNGTTIVPANGTAKIQFVVYTGLSISSALPSTINLSNIPIGEEYYSFSLPVEYCVEV